MPIPDDAWEYQIRKSLNDAAYQGLEYVPYCTTMPVKANSEDVAFMWVRARDTSVRLPYIVDTVRAHIYFMERRVNGVRETAHLLSACRRVAAPLC